MTTVAIQYSVTTAITCTMATLAASSARGSTPVYNTSAKYDDAVLHLEVQTNSSAPADTAKACFVYLYTSPDGVTWSGSRTENVSTDIAVTLDSPTNLIYADTLNMPAATTVYRADIPLVPILGQMPAAWGFVIQNRTGNALNTTSANLIATYSGINYTIA
jgi:hypothetical protein